MGCAEAHSLIKSLAIAAVAAIEVELATRAVTAERAPTAVAVVGATAAATAA